MRGNFILLVAASCLVYLGMTQEHYPITGSPVDSNNAVPLRLNINTLQAEGGPQWDLYIQALQAMQERNSDDKLSYFQISGIHGLPYIEWDRSGPRRGTNWLGYCPHGEAIFAPWHRPYVLLFEQELVKLAQEIAEKYPESQRDKYRNAAKRLRAPYWDWAADSAVPSCSVPSRVTVNIPDGNTIKQSSIKNPLQTYTLPAAALNGRYGVFDRNRRQQIYRCRIPYSYPGSANANLRTRYLKTNVYAAFIYPRNFDEFSQTGNNGVGIEQIHNWIHIDASCGEQFSTQDLSGFDPLFMLHHANVDRLWAYWQYIKPDQSIFDYSYGGQSRFSTPLSTTITTDSPLQPFFAANGSFHTTRSMASINGFGYTYDGLEYWNKSSIELQRSATALINSLYANQRSKDIILDTESSWSGEKNPFESSQTASYFIRLKIDRSQVDRPCTINVYIDGLKAGDIPIMAQPTVGSMTGSFAVDDFFRKFLATALTANRSTASIADRFEIDISRPDGSHIPITSIPSLTMSFEEISSTSPKSIDVLPVAGEPIVHCLPLVDRSYPKIL